MRISHLKVQNYRGLRDVALPLSRFACFIGKNNAGKSTVLQAISLFFSGTKLSKKDFFDPMAPIRIEIRFEGIDDDDISRIAPEHREKIQSVVIDGTITLVRCYDTTGSGKLRIVTMVPKEERFRNDKIAGVIRGLKSGELLSAVISVFPELDNQFTATTITQAKVKDAIKVLAAAIPDANKEVCDTELVTGIDASIKALLPEPIYIPAVKNLADEVKAKESTPFGKVVSILLAAIEPQLGDVKRFFTELSKKFNRFQKEDGTVADERIPEVKKIESTVEKFLRESFSNVAIEMSVPPPDLKTILSSAELLIDDGVKGGIESKGDGLRRAAVFAILRSYVALNEPGAIGQEQDTLVRDRHILLFEEPELYLHPSAQKVLFDALSLFSKHNHVLISTHSPAFFGPGATASFVKLQKTTDPAIAKTPYTLAHPIDLSEVNAKDQFQLICFENNNAAFFFDLVVLVEGDSDYIVLPHIASLLTTGWDTVSGMHKFVRINGKGSIRRYREFFRKFGVRVAVVSDLDLLTDGFSVLEPDNELNTSRCSLIEVVDKVIEANGGFVDAPNKKIVEANGRTELIGRWKAAKRKWMEVQAGASEVEALMTAVDSFFSWEKQSQRLQVLRDSSNADVKRKKRELLSMLRKHDVYVLEKGPLEAYYPENIAAGDKPARAQEFCRNVTTREQALSLSDQHYDADEKAIGTELELICCNLFTMPER